MKKIHKILLAPFILFLLLFLGGCGQAKKVNVYQKVKQSRTMIWGTRADTRLFGYMDIKSSKIIGFEIDMAKAVTKQMLGKDAVAKFVQTTPKTRIPLLKNRNINAIWATMTITPERKKQVDFARPYIGAGASLLVPNNSKIKDVHQLNNKKVLAVKGTTAVADIKKVAPKAKVLEYDDYGQAFSALKAGQGVALTTDNCLLAGIAGENPGFHLIGKNYTNQPYGIAVDKGQAELRDHINKALLALKKNGTYHRLLVKWFDGIPGFNIKEAEVL